MSDSTKIPGFRYVGTTSNPAFVTQDGRVRIGRVTLRTWVVQPGGVGGFEVAGREAAIREARRVAAELAAEDARVLIGSMPKTRREIAREVDEILRSGSDTRPVIPRAHSTVGVPEIKPTRKLTARRAKDFRDSGNYEVRDESGTVVTLIYRDPERREWYEENLPGTPQTHFIDRWRGSTQAEALAAIARRRGY